MKCVIPCAGKSKRMGLDTPKVLLEINGRSILGHIIHQWSDIVDKFIIIVSRENEEIIRRSSGKAIFAIQDPLKGIADAILQAEPYIEEGFVVSLGDCLYKGKFTERYFGQGIGVLKEASYEELIKSYTVDISDKGLVTNVWEKSLRGRYCGMGVYFFTPEVFDYIRKTPPSPLRGEVEITDTIQLMIDSGEKITPVWFVGNYINVTYPEDIKKAEELFGQEI